MCLRLERSSLNPSVCKSLQSTFFTLNGKRVMCSVQWIALTLCCSKQRGADASSSMCCKNILAKTIKRGSTGTLRETPPLTLSCGRASGAKLNLYWQSFSIASWMSLLFHYQICNLGQVIWLPTVHKSLHNFLLVTYYSICLYQLQ